ncbi:MAG TPA: hypothetical protein VKI44_09040 [Acetobacteraceae bacterium]|nr:hypothetical protein [Acetobacteraceae bacterium]
MPPPEEQEQEQKLLEAQGMAEAFQALAQDQSLPPEQAEMYANLQRSALAGREAPAEGAGARPACDRQDRRTRRERLAG